MAARSSTSSRIPSSSQGRLLLCSHGEKPVLRISGTKENPGRRFWGCVYFEVQEGCNFFHWADPDTEVEYSEIARLRKKLSMMKSRTKVAEWKLKFVAVLGFFGYILLLFLVVNWPGWGLCIKGVLDCGMLNVFEDVI
ncbi:uncharacterized protein LOC130966551 [Arachis stenosperma]|uniref:uncharacterized protein LOC130966551 n=1 Tax=Arachis stenosperma TaxID=217475 RepID=UPI0025ACEB8E|nr:uncharacterized protein LOC130966551 [Arachis stenosperma]